MRRFLAGVLLGAVTGGLMSAYMTQHSRAARTVTRRVPASAPTCTPEALVSALENLDWEDMFEGSGYLYGWKVTDFYGLEPPVCRDPHIDSTTQTIECQSIFGQFDPSVYNPLLRPR